MLHQPSTACAATQCAVVDTFDSVEFVGYVEAVHMDG
jgi:hypothetical protein